MSAVQKWEVEFSKLGGDLAVVQQMRSRYGDEIPEFDTIGQDCADFARKKPIGTVTGLFVTRIRDAAARANRVAPMSAAERIALQERGAAFMVQLLQIVAEQAPSPSRIADVLEEARAEGIPVNLLTIDRLRTFGHRWPGEV